MEVGAVGVEVGAGAQQRERALGREDLEVVERRRPEAAEDEPVAEVGVAAVGGEVLRRVVRRGDGEGAAGAVGGEELDDAEVALEAGDDIGVAPSLSAWFTLAFAASSFATISVWPLRRR